MNDIQMGDMKDVELNSSTKLETGLDSSISGFNLSRKHILYAAFIILSLFCGIAITGLPLLKQFVMIAAIPAILVIFIILKDPLNGIYLFFLYDYLRPYDFIPALRPLRLSLVIEVLTLISWLLYVKQMKLKIKWSNFNYYFVGFILVIAAMIPLAVNNRMAYNTWQAMSITFLIYLIATNRINSVDKLNKLIWILLLVFAYFALKGIYNYAILRHVVGSERTSGVVGGSFISDENDFALALNFMIPFAFFYFMEAYKGIKRYACLGILLLFVLGVIASDSRGGWVGLVVAVLLVIIWSKRRIIGLSITAVLAVAVVLFAPSNFWTEVGSISEVHEGTAQSRINYWKAGVRMFLTHPILGVGAGNGPIRMPQFVEGWRDVNTQWGRTFHGTIPQIMAELGAAGLLAYLAMILYAVRHLRKLVKTNLAENGRMIRIIAKAIIVSIITYIVTATFLSTAYYPELWTLYVFTTILLFIAKEQGTRVQLKAPTEEGPRINYPYIAN